MRIQNKIFITFSIMCSLSLGALAADIDYTNPSQERINYKYVNESDKNMLQKDILHFINSINPYVKDTESSSIPESIGYQEYENATKKFMQGNTAVSYKEFKSILDNIDKEDFLYVSLAYKFTNMGFFSLAQDALSKIENKSVWEPQTDLIVKKYFPKNQLSSEEELYLAGLYSDIYFHNLAFEVIKDLSKNDKLLKKSDYANYLLSLTYYETKEYKKALSAINKAIDMNPDNINYQKNKAQVLCELKEYKRANKIMAELVKEADDLVMLKQEIFALQEYILAKSSSKEYLSKYHLGKYFYIKNDNARAIKTLNQSLSMKKKYYPAMTLLGEIYTKEQNYPKANEVYTKAYKLNKNYPDTLFGLGDLQFKEGNVQNALNYFLVAVKKDKNYLHALLYSAMCYKILNQPDIALKMCEDALVLNPKNPDTYYVLSKIDTANKVEHLKKVTSYNPLYVDAWLDLAQNSISKQNIKEAKNYLLPVQYIDSNNYKAYYYQGLIEKYQRHDEMAMIYFEKSVKLNPSYEPALNEVNSEI